MKLVLTLLVRNEEDILRENILFHLDMGVDLIIVTDNNSEDGTVEIAREFERAGAVKLIFEPEDDYSQWKWVTRMAEMAHSHYHADWIINSDADEFWWPGKGDLKSALALVPEEFKVVSVPRNDFIPRPETDGPLFDRMIIKDLQSKNHIGLSLPPKACHRAMPGVVVAQGNHSLTEPAGLEPFRNSSLEIMHFPMRSYRQFEQKIAFGGAALERNERIPKTTQKGWRDLYEAFKTGNLHHYYESKIIRPDELARGFAGGRFTYDSRLRDFLKEKNIIH